MRNTLSIPLASMACVDENLAATKASLVSTKKAHINKRILIMMNWPEIRITEMSHDSNEFHIIKKYVDNAENID